MAIPDIAIPTFRLPIAGTGQTAEVAFVRVDTMKEADLAVPVGAEDFLYLRYDRRDLVFPQQDPFTRRFIASLGDYLNVRLHPRRANHILHRVVNEDKVDTESHFIPMGHWEAFVCNPNTDPKQERLSYILETCGSLFSLKVVDSRYDGGFYAMVNHPQLNEWMIGTLTGGDDDYAAAHFEIFEKPWFPGCVGPTVTLAIAKLVSKLELMSKQQFKDIVEAGWAPDERDMTPSCLAVRYFKGDSYPELQSFFDQALYKDYDRIFREGGAG